MLGGSLSIKFEQRPRKHYFRATTVSFWLDLKVLLKSIDAQESLLALFREYLLPLLEVEQMDWVLEYLLPLLEVEQMDWVAEDIQQEC